MNTTLWHDISDCFESANDNLYRGASRDAGNSDSAYMRCSETWSTRVAIPLDSMVAGGNFNFPLSKDLDFREMPPLDSVEILPHVRQSLIDIFDVTTLDRMVEESTESDYTKLLRGELARLALAAEEASEPLIALQAFLNQLVSNDERTSPTKTLRSISADFDKQETDLNQRLRDHEREISAFQSSLGDGDPTAQSKIYAAQSQIEDIQKHLSDLEKTRNAIHYLLEYLEELSSLVNAISSFLQGVQIELIERSNREALLSNISRIWKEAHKRWGSIFAKTKWPLLTGVCLGCIAALLAALFIASVPIPSILIASFWAGFLIGYLTSQAVTKADLNVLIKRPLSRFENVRTAVEDDERWLSTLFASFARRSSKPKTETDVLGLDSMSERFSDTSRRVKGWWWFTAALSLLVFLVILQLNVSTDHLPTHFYYTKTSSGDGICESGPVVVRWPGPFFVLLTGKEGSDESKDTRFFGSEAVVGYSSVGGEHPRCSSQSEKGSFSVLSARKNIERNSTVSYSSTQVLPFFSSKVKGTECSTALVRMKGKPSQDQAYAFLGNLGKRLRNCSATIDVRGFASRVPFSCGDRNDVEKSQSLNVALAESRRLFVICGLALGTAAKDLSYQQCADLVSASEGSFQNDSGLMNLHKWNGPRWGGSFETMKSAQPYPDAGQSTGSEDDVLARVVEIEILQQSKSCVGTAG